MNELWMLQIKETIKSVMMRNVLKNRTITPWFLFAERVRVLFIDSKSSFYTFNLIYFKMIPLRKYIENVHNVVNPPMHG